MQYEFSQQSNELFEALESAISNLDIKDGQADDALLRSAAASLASTGYLNLGLSEAGESPAMFRAMEAAAAASPSLYLKLEVSARVFGRAVAQWGSDWQKEKILSPLLFGELLGTLALSEKALNVENDPLQTMGEKNGDAVVVNGRKQFVVNGAGADCIAVAGTLDGQGALFLIPKGAKGMEMGPPISALGYESAGICSLELKDCAVSEAQVISGLKMDDMLDMLRFWENQVLIGASLGLMKASFEEARVYAKSHKTGGRPIIAYQEVGFRLSDMLTLHQTAQLLAYRAGWMADAKDKEAQALTLCAKVFATEASEKVSSDALKILGAKGFSTPNPAESGFRSSKYGQIAGTSTEISRMKIGDAVLGKRK
ncbi:butyryl-CoA dehydrogenase [Desulfatibacillum alkenivorans DSM 16219]|jgi:alkylation response protein AidB-like acyl-CoA dehydrogenase|uniref:Butyryl-CoA dehydrogenase n=1 Tax=Desulfatibacillum alkenivorans DSM 16219 TaxID=1121393 RepID=A0A1M6UPA9_9BACT|nr:acyl-CoA dehydrogenase [Desulfatibacillum alkenivorans]SHK71016.1 butyryl-CoA dehydrogenase [Desulfatibacillum alkenivorans DSM 16219]